MDGISAAERQPTYPEGGPKDNETYAEDGSGEDDIDTEDGSREHGFDRKGGCEEGGFNTKVVDDRIVRIFFFGRGLRTLSPKR